jgi:hypothetical protein
VHPRPGHSLPRGIDLVLGKKCPEACSKLTQSIQLKIQTLEGIAVGTTEILSSSLLRAIPSRREVVEGAVYDRAFSCRTEDVLRKGMLPY